jgi:hypothetical protein
MNRTFAISLTLAATGLGGVPAVEARSDIILVQPNQPVKAGLQFNVTRTLDNDPKQFQFTVEIIPQNTELPREFTAALGFRHFEGRSVSVGGLRTIPCETANQRLTCHFTVPITTTQHPELGFLLTVPVVLEVDGKRLYMPASTMWYLPFQTLANP